MSADAGEPPPGPAPAGTGKAGSGRRGAGRAAALRLYLVALPGARGGLTVAAHHIHVEGPG